MKIIPLKNMLPVLFLLGMLTLSPSKGEESTSEFRFSFTDPPLETEVLWQFPQANPNVEILEEEGKSFLRVHNADATTDPVARLTIPLDPSWTVVEIGVEMRVKDFGPGDEDWNTAMVDIIFQDQNGERVGDFGATPRLRNDSDWVELSVRRDVPTGATQLVLRPGLLFCTGKADFDNFFVRSPQ